MTYSKNTVCRRLLITGVAALSTAACMHSSSDNPLVASATLSNTQDQPTGFVAIRNDADGPMMSIEAKGLTPGVYAMHFHQTGRCDAPGFTTAGSHWNPAGRQHGLSNVNGPHAGDLPNIEVKSDGKAVASVRLSSALIDGERSLFDADGAAVVIHAKPDDNMTDPSGNSGERILCGVLQQQPN